MPVQIKQENGGKLVAVHVTGKLVRRITSAVYPSWSDSSGQHGKIAPAVRNDRFHGWKPARLWTNQARH